MTDLSLQAVPLPTPERRVAPVVALVPRRHPDDGPELRPDLRPDPQPEPIRFAHRPRWSAFRYAMPGTDRSALRSSIWRELQAMGALKLQPGIWAVAQREGGDTPLASLRERVRAAGGEAECDEVDHVDRLDVRLQSRLDRSCERVWDELLDATDWFESQVEAGVLSPDERDAALDGLRARYASTLPRDLVGSATGRYAADRLHQLATATPDRPAPASAPLRGRAPVRRRVLLDARWLLRGGDTMLVTHLHPLPDREWETGFQAFESWAYRPSAGRPSLEHGTMRGAVASEDVEGAVARLATRVRSFESSLDHG